MSLKFCRIRGSSRVVRLNLFDQRVSIAWTGVYPITINARDDFYTIDLINEIGRPQFYRTMGEPQRDTWLLKETAMKIGCAINKEIMGSWRIKIVQSQQSIVLQANWTVRDFHDEISYKMVFFSS